jgi:transcriptional regulator with XRE-family HTH domain
MARIGVRDEVDAYVGARIGLRRSALGLSQSALAQQLGISFQQVQKYETGQNRISASRLHRAATVLGTSVETFFPPVETARGAADDSWRQMRSITATAEGRTVAAEFPLIGNIPKADYRA